jgi:hypothetical protein
MSTEQQLQRGVEQARENATVNVSLTQVEQPKFTNLKLERNIVLNDFIFNTVDDYGVVWVVTEMGGWWDSPAPEVPDIARGFGDGSYDVQGRYTARTINLQGVFLTPDPSMVEAARDRLTAAVDLVYKGAWLLTGSNPVRASFVRLVDQPRFQTVNARGRTEFEIPLRAPDPIKYSWNDSQPDGYDIVEILCSDLRSPSNGSAVIENIGNYRVPAILQVSGPIIGPASIYNKTTDELILIVDGFSGASSASVENKQLTFDEDSLLDIATLTTRAPHGFSVGSGISVSGVGFPFDGEYTINSIPTDTTFTYERLPEVAKVNQISYRTLQSNVATIETVNNHGYSVGDRVLIKNLNQVFDGTYQIASVPSPNRFTYTDSRVPVATVTGKQLTSNVATLTTGSPHGFLVGEQVTVSGVDATNFNGTYTISEVSSDGLRFSYPKNRTDSRQITSHQISSRIATITTAIAHGFSAGEQVSIENLTSAYNGTHTIISTPSSTTFTYRVVRSTQSRVVVKAATVISGTNGVATITTQGPNGIIAGDQILVEEVDSTFNGTRTVTQVPSNTTASYDLTGLAAAVIPTNVEAGRLSISRRWIIRRNLIGNKVTLTTINAHGILVGESVTVANLGTPYDGTYVVTDVTSNTFSYTRTSANILDNFAGVALQHIRRDSNVATINTGVLNHGLSNNDLVLVGNVADSSFNGYHRITVTGLNTFTYPSVGPNVVPPPPTNLDDPLPVVPAGEGSFVLEGIVTLSGSVALASSNTATATVAGSLPFSAANGTATVSSNIPRAIANSGVAVRKADIQFTPGVQDGSVTVDADLLEINTQDREVAFNGELIGARAKIDVLADFIKLTPGNNEIEFVDNGNPESTAVLRVFYRSGWLS